MLKQSDYIFLTKLNISLNNILVFAVVMNSGGLLPASYYMNCSQAAISVSLKKFCTCFPSKLFNRDGRRLIPTPEAIALYESMIPVILGFREVLECGIDNLGNAEKNAAISN